MKLPEEPKWVMEYNFDCYTKSVIIPKKILKLKGKVSKNPGLRENETK